MTCNTILPPEEDFDKLVKADEDEEKKALERGDIEAIEAAIKKEYLESHNLGPDEYDFQYQQFQYQQMVDDADDSTSKADVFD